MFPCWLSVIQTVLRRLIFITVAAWEHIAAIAPYDEFIKLYLKQVTAEQLQAHVTPKQATPIFPDKLLLLSRHFEKRLLLPNLSPSEMFVVACDQAFFKCLFYSGDHAGDLGLVKTPEIAHFPDDSVLLFNHIWGKTLRDGSSNLFGMRCHPNPALCPIRAVEMYVAVSLCRCVRLVLTFPGVTCSGLQIRRSPRLSASHQFHGRISLKAVSSTS